MGGEEEPAVPEFAFDVLIEDDRLGIRETWRLHHPWSAYDGVFVI